MQRNFHHKKAPKSGSSNEWNIYRSLRNEVSTCIRKAKETYYSNLIVENKSNSSKLRYGALSNQQLVQRLDQLKFNLLKLTAVILPVQRQSQTLLHPFLKP